MVLNGFFFFLIFELEGIFEALGNKKLIKIKIK